jgi:hypothetical protein
MPTDQPTIITADSPVRAVRPFVIGIGYRARQGKDTLAYLVHERIPRASRVYRFGDALKATCRLLGMMEEKHGPTLQTAGDFFGHLRVVRALQYQIEEESPEVAIIADIRCPMEYEWVIERGGLLVEVIRLTDVGAQYIDPSRPSAHWSEESLQGFPFHLQLTATSGDLSALEQAAGTIASIASYGVAQNDPRLITR